MITLFQTSPKSGGNSGSVAPAITYFTKEDKNRDPNEICYGFFTTDETGITPEAAQELIEHKLYSKSLSKEDSKFFHVLISFSQHELEGKSDKELIEFAQKNFADMYLEAGKRYETDPSQLAWCAKLEKTRKYKGDDKEVLQGAKKSGQLKEGDQRHIHIVVARKTLNNRKISPLSKHFKEGQKKGNVNKGFDQDAFRLSLQFEFDDHFSHSRKKDEQYDKKLLVTRPDLDIKDTTSVKMLNKINDRKLDELSALISAKAKKVRAFIDRSSENVRKYLIHKIKSFAFNRGEHMRNLRPQLIPQPVPLKPNIHHEEIQKPFNFFEELKKIEEQEKILNSKFGKISNEDFTKEILELHEHRKRLMDKNMEEQKRSAQEKKPGQDRGQEFTR